MSLRNNVTFVTLKTFYVHLYNICDEANPLLYGEEQSFFKAVLRAELCFHRYVHFVCFPIYIFGLHQKQYASD